MRIIVVSQCCSTEEHSDRTSWYGNMMPADNDQSMGWQCIGGGSPTKCHGSAVADSAGISAATQ